MAMKLNALPLIALSRAKFNSGLHFPYL